MNTQLPQSRSAQTNVRILEVRNSLLPSFSSKSDIFLKKRKKVFLPMNLIEKALKKKEAGVRFLYSCT